MIPGDVGAVGYQPSVSIRPSEREIYKELWETDEYRQVSPGEDCAEEFVAIARPPKGASVLDIGCGTGRGALHLALLHGLDVTMLDFASNCLDADIVPMLDAQPHALRFVEHDLGKPIPVSAVYGFCADVMEHIGPQKLDIVLDNILMAAQHCFFQIATEPDVCGRLVGHKLHLTVKPYKWWLKKFRDRDCVIHWSKNGGNCCSFYVSAWQDAHAIVDIGILNIAEDVIQANVKHNIAQGWDQVHPHETNDTEVMILGGGPTLSGFLPDIIENRANGIKLVTLNGAYNWALENGLVPSAQIIVDAREFNARFTSPVVEDCKYLIASQVDPSVLEGLPRDRTLLWHTSADAIRDILDEQYEVWWGIPGGSTVLLRAIPLLRMLGFRKFHLYGCDSCLTDDAHHAYAQPENDEELVIPVTIGNRVFRCHVWQASQAQEFIDLIKCMGEEMEIEVYGDGLLAHIITTGADSAQLEKE